MAQRSGQLEYIVTVRTDSRFSRQTPCTIFCRLLIRDTGKSSNISAKFDPHVDSSSEADDEANVGLYR